MTYRGLARRYRPQSLKDVIGQSEVVDVLEQEIITGRIGQGFVFHGIRGIGKTTIARIFAKCLNCLGKDNNSPNPTIKPCDECMSCQGFLKERHLDVIEIDAASHTGVDDMRELTDSSRYKAVQGRYKVFIIDEAHMLSKSAFNALLKTLEEPPAHVIFILATTEIRKIPDTILSRCQRFDLKKMSIDTIVQRLRFVMDQEQISIDDKALYLIARAADGSMRDGLSLLDQGIALGLKDIHHSKVTGDFIEKMLGFSNQDHLFDVWDLIFDAQTTQLITKVQTLIDQGADALLLMQDLLDTLYWIIILKQSPQLCHDLSWPEVQRDRGSSLSHKLSMGVLLMMWQMMTNGYEEITKSPNPLQAIQIVLMRLCYLKTLTPIENLILYEQQNISNSNNINIDTKPSITSSLNNNDPIEIRNFQDLVQLLEDHKEMLMMEELKMCAQACEINSYTIKIGTQRDSFKDSYRTLEKKINQITKKNWKIIITTNKNEINSMPVVEDIKKTMKNKALEHPVIKKMLDNLPKGTTISV